MATGQTAIFVRQAGTGQSGRKIGVHCAVESIFGCDKEYRLAAECRHIVDGILRAPDCRVCSKPGNWDLIVLPGRQIFLPRKIDETDHRSDQTKFVSMSLRESHGAISSH